jgi:hypothetical protein
MRRKCIIGLVALGLTATAAVRTPGYCRIYSSARSFGQYFKDLKAGSSLSPVERFVFSLILANSKKQAQAGSPIPAALPPSRT